MEEMLRKIIIIKKSSIIWKRNKSKIIRQMIGEIVTKKYEKKYNIYYAELQWIDKKNIGTTKLNGQMT